MILSGQAKTKFHLITEEYQGEPLCFDEAAKITKLVKRDLMESYVIILAKTLMIKRSLHIDHKAKERETCMIDELEPIFKIVKLDEVLRCTNEISRITKSIQNFVRKKVVFLQQKLRLYLNSNSKPKAFKNI